MRNLCHSRAARLALLAVLLVSAGCRGPMEVVTRNTMRVDDTQGPLVAQRVERLPAVAPWKIAIIDVDGLLLNVEMTGIYSEGENPVAVFREKLEAAAADSHVRALVVRINTHGGGVTASDIMRHDLLRYKEMTGKPVVACLLDVGAGGGYYLATAADHIVAHPTSVVGGIGVIINLYNLQDAMAQFNVLGMPVKAGDNTDIGTPLHALEPGQEELLQQIADEYHARFREAVEMTRPTTSRHANEIFDGRIVTGRRALEIGLVDSLGYLDDAVMLARAAGGAPNAATYVYHRCDDRARSHYDITPNVPLHAAFTLVSMPGFDRSRLPTFLYAWQPDPTMERLGGR